MKKLLTLTNRNPVQYEADFEALSDLFVNPTETIIEDLLEVIANADEEFCASINYGIEQTDPDDCFECQIENFGVDGLGVLIMSAAMVSSKKLAVYFHYNPQSSYVDIDIILSDPEAAKIEFRKRLDKVKGLREAITFEEPVRITA